MAQRVDVPEGVVFVGSTRTLQVPIRSTSKLPQDMGGLTLRWQLREDRESVEALLTKVSGVGIALTSSELENAVDDVVNVTISYADTWDSSDGEVLIQPGRYWHALVDSNGVPIFYGEFWLTAFAARPVPVA